MRLSSRRRHKMPTHLPLRLIRGGREDCVDLPILQHPIMLSFPVFAVPSLISGKHVEGVSIRRAAIYNFGRPIKAVLTEFKADDARVTESSRPVAFARLLAKIAWGIAVIHGRRPDLDSGLRDAMLYEPNRIGRWVGTYTDPLEPGESNMMHEIRLREDVERGLFVADVILFANTTTPRYGVILGPLGARSS